MFNMTVLNPMLKKSLAYRTKLVKTGGRDMPWFYAYTFSDFTSLFFKHEHPCTFENDNKDSIDARHVIFMHKANNNILY